MNSVFDKKDTEGINGPYTDFRSDVVAATVVDNGFDAAKRKGVKEVEQLVSNNRVKNTIENVKAWI
jgi:hypothetical protein